MFYHYDELSRVVMIEKSVFIVEMLLLIHLAELATHLAYKQHKHVKI